MEKKNSAFFLVFGSVIGILVIVIIFLLCKKNDKRERIPANATKTYHYLKELNESSISELPESDWNLIRSVNAVRANHTHVINPDKILPDSVCGQLDSILLKMDSLEVYGVVAVCEHFKGDDPQDFSMGVGQYLEIGGPKSMGFVVALATLDRSYWISTGVGLEKILNNEDLKQMLDDYMVPYLRKAAWGQSLISILEKMHDYVRKRL